SLETIFGSVLPGKLSLPDVRFPFAVFAGRIVTPGIEFSFQAATRGEFPFRFRRQTLAGPFAVCNRIEPGDMHDRMQLFPVKSAARALRMLPTGAWGPVPPLRIVAKIFTGK